MIVLANVSVVSFLSSDDVVPHVFQDVLDDEPAIKIKQFTKIPTLNDKWSQWTTWFNIGVVVF